MSSNLPKGHKWEEVADQDFVTEWECEDCKATFTVAYEPQDGSYKTEFEPGEKEDARCWDK